MERHQSDGLNSLVELTKSDKIDVLRTEPHGFNRAGVFDTVMD